MRKIMLPLLMAAMLFAMPGCAESRKASREFNTLSELYRSKMDAGKTTANQDKEYIRAIARLGYELDRAIRGTKAADKTRHDASIMGTTGIDPNAPLRLPEIPRPPSEEQP
jgi:hypothetical protein